MKHRIWHPFNPGFEQAKTVEVVCTKCGKTKWPYSSKRIVKKKYVCELCLKKVKVDDYTD